MDLLFMITFVGHVFYYYWGDVEKNKTKYLTYSCITIAHLMTLILKFMQYVRIFEKFSFLIEMIIEVNLDLGPFLILFFIFNALFTLIIDIMGARVPDDDGNYNNYSGLPSFIKEFIHTFRLSIGDLIIPDISSWMNEMRSCSSHETDDAVCSYDYFGEGAIFFIWIFWMINVFLMMVILLNFLIAEVGQTYDNVK